MSGTIRLQPEYSDPSTATSLQSYVTGPGLPAGVSCPQADDAGQLVGSLLAQVLMIPPGGEPRPTGAAISSVLAGLSALNVLTAEDDSVGHARPNYAVVLTAGAFTGSDADDRNTTLADLVTALDARGLRRGRRRRRRLGRRTTASSASIRADPALSAAVSTVDNVDHRGRADQHRPRPRRARARAPPGKYGTGQDTQPVPPVPAPTP